MGVAASRWVLAVLCAAVPMRVARADETPAQALIRHSIGVHDPAGAWRRGAWRLEIEESRPDGTVRPTRIEIDTPAQTFAWVSTRQGHDVEGRLWPDGCEVRIDGREDVSAEEADALGVGCERLAWIRDYYTYLWGLPMKLLDPGTLVAPEVAREDFLGRAVESVRVSYEEAVGTDTWYFYFDPETSALVGYRSYHDESAGDGEYIRLDGLHEQAGLRLPAERTWYTNDGNELLGTDRLVSIERRP